MPDSFVLYGPGGASPVQLASYVDLTQGGPDFGAAGVQQAQISQTALADGGQLAYEFAGPRKMRFPLSVPSGAGGLSLHAFETLLRYAARPGGYLDIQPNGVPSTEAVRFDLIAGRWEPNYETRVHALARRRGLLDLDTQPYGYWPTWITAATWTGKQVKDTITVSGFIGDAPADTRMQVRVLLATSPGQFPIAGTWLPELLAPSFRRVASFVPYVPVAGIAGGVWTPVAFGGSYFSDATYGVGISATYYRYPLTGGNSWARTFFMSIQASQTYYGRFRAFGWMRLTPSTGFPARVLLDVCDQGDPGLAMASGNSVATVNPAVASNQFDISGWGANPSGGYQLVDLGEISIPRNPAASAVASGNTVELRLWANSGASQVATPLLDISSFWLHPADQGLVMDGLQIATVSNVNFYATHMVVQTDTTRRAAELAYYLGDTSLSPQPAWTDLWPYWRGPLPRLTASDSALNILQAGKRINTAATWPLAQAANWVTDGRLEFRPRFLFVKGF